MSLGLAGLPNAYFQNHCYKEGGAVKGSPYDFNHGLVTKGINAVEEQKRPEVKGSLCVEEYKKYLEKKYGRVTIQSVGRDQANLERAGKAMNGHDVVIAPNILKEMAENPERAAYFEEKIDSFFRKGPEYTAYFAAKGLAHEPGGVIIHEDGTVTYIGGCSDSPERAARVAAENQARRKKETERRTALLEGADLTKEQEMELFQQEFWAEVARIPKTSTIDHLAIRITDKGWERMKEEPEYREQMMNLIRRDTTGSFIHQVDSVITIGGSAQEYRASSWSSGSDEFWDKAKDDCYMEARKKRKKELKEYYDKLWQKHFYEQRKLIKGEKNAGIPPLMSDVCNLYEGLIPFF